METYIATWILLYYIYILDLKPLRGTKYRVLLNFNKDMNNLMLLATDIVLIKSISICYKTIRKMKIKMLLIMIY